MHTLPKHGRCEATTSASPDEVWRVLSDPTRLGQWSHETRRGEPLQRERTWRRHQRKLAERVPCGCGDFARERFGVQRKQARGIRAGCRPHH